jgi:hypothetical protein
MQGGTIVQRKANEFLSNEFLEKVLAANPNCWGAALVSDNELQLNSGEEGASLDFVQETMQSFPDKDITFYFGHADAALNKADIPPHILIVKKEGEEEIPLIVGFFDGNFPAYDKGGSSHPPEWHLANDYLIPKLEGLMEMADGDLNKVTEQLKKEYFKKELLLTSVSRGTITLVCANGTCLSFTQKDDPNTGDIPGGWTSNKHGYKTEAAKEPDKPVKRSMFDRVVSGNRSTVREKVVIQPDNVTAATEKLAEAASGFPKGAPSADALAKATAAAKTGTTAKPPVPEGYTVKSERPGAHLSRREKKDWYPIRIGHRPSGWEKNIAVDVIYGPDGKMRTYSQIQKLGLEAAPILALLKNNPAKDNTKDIEPNDVRPEDTLPVEKQVTAEVLPIMSPSTREHIKAMMTDAKVQKIIAENADIIQDPATVAALEAKFSDFARQLGAKSLDEFIPWSYEMMLDLAKTRPDGLAVMCWTYRNIVAAHRSKKLPSDVVIDKIVEDATTKKRGMFARAG